MRIAGVFDLSNAVKCPVCGSHEIFVRGGEWKNICLICYHRFPRALLENSTTPHRTPAKIAIALTACGACASLAGLLAIAIHAGTSGHVPGLVPSQHESRVSIPAGSTRAESALTSQGRASSRAYFGSRRWVKGFMHRPSSCAPLPAGVTPRDDAMTAGSSPAANVGALARGDEYDLIYSDGIHVSVYSSSVSECRRIVNRWDWWA